MKSFQNILVALDFKAIEQAEIDHALVLARNTGAKVTFISVIPPLPRDAHLEISAMSPEERLQKQIDKRYAQLQDVAGCIRSHGVEVDIIALSGNPCTEIIRQVLRAQHDLLMVSGRASPGIKNRLIGTTARQLLRKCPCPVWAVHPDHPGEYERIMAAIDVTRHRDVDNNKLNEAIVSIAQTIKETDQGELYILNVPPREEDKPAHMDIIVHCLQSRNVAVKKRNIHLETGEPVAVIVESSRKYRVDLLVMGMLSRAGIKGFFIGNTIEKIMDDVECSILAIKPEEFVTPVTLD